MAQPRRNGIDTGINARFELTAKPNAQENQRKGKYHEHGFCDFRL